ncbi:cob(I)yrinic acid a,c-diamide adenosyltransferase [candidate division WWE3 bacterium]|nr:cob(I)yrinic acid a,c-diamide adenosyltransferase [candidate division WWE3 bacterium]
MSIYTGTGDKGETSLYGTVRVPKDSLEIEALGGLDELNGILGLAGSFCQFKELSVLILEIQITIFDIGAEISITLGNRKARKSFSLPRSKVKSLEKEIDGYDARLEKTRTFVLPGGTALSSHLHFARAACRRVERVMVALSRERVVNQEILVYLNRLSDLLFVLARYSNLKSGVKDIFWES